ncbi:hypothetical protein BDV95DRAFT_614512 [Massariosphaeria phaeospora]|uniref:Uncharacterized protein n=1 Tax=Massariosphaeria phaeospora TaxID=100035 RepID=A0A7C8MCY3_9PLEO|nr:hypothetical protein BDV95DRAFT_614512 [Massariosphaeria phaeospora]
MSSIGLQLLRPMRLILDAILDPIMQKASPVRVDRVDPPENSVYLEGVSMGPVEAIFQPSEATEATEDRELDAASTAWDLVHTKVCYWPQCQINHHTSQSPIYNVVGEYFRLGSGYNMPSYLPEIIKRALLMANQCDFTVMFLNDTVRKVVQKFDSDAKVSWLAIIPRPRFQFRFTFRSQMASLHSVLLLEMSNGDRFVLDASGEQFGIPRDHQFLPWHTYRDLYVIKREDCPSQVRLTRDTGGHALEIQDLAGVFGSQVLARTNAQIHLWEGVQPLRWESLKDLTPEAFDIEVRSLQESMRTALAEF